MIQVAVYDTKSYDREYLERASQSTEIEWLFFEFRLSAETARSADGCRAVCAFVNDRIDRACLEQLVKLGVRLLLLRCAGYNNVDLAAARELGLPVVRVPAYSPHAVAEHAVGLLMALNRKLHRAYNRVRELNFSLEGLVGFDLHCRRVGVVGTGKIGRIAAQVFRGFGAEVMAVDPYPATEWAQSCGVTYVDQDQLFRESDVISLHAPLVPETHELLNAASIARMKRGVYIINTSRGKLVDTGALIEALKSGQVGGVALDVYEEEEGVFFEDLSGQILPDDELARLLTFPNVLISAHQGFLTHEALSEIARVTVENVGRLIHGAALLADTVVTDGGTG